MRKTNNPSTAMWPRFDRDNWYYSSLYNTIWWATGAGSHGRRHLVIRGLLEAGVTDTVQNVRVGHALMALHRSDLMQLQRDVQQLGPVSVESVEKYSIV